MLSGVLLGAVQVVGSLAAAALQPDRVTPDTPLAVALLLAGPVMLAVTRRPVLRAVVATVAAVCYLAFGYALGPVLLTAVLTLALAVLAGRQAVAWLLGVTGLAAALMVSRMAGHPFVGSVVLQSAGWGSALLLSAAVVRARRESAEAWSRARTQARLSDAGEQRLHLVRDLHDEVVHQIHLARGRAAAALTHFGTLPAALPAAPPGFLLDTGSPQGQGFDLLTGSLFGSRVDPGRGRRPPVARRDVGSRAVDHPGAHGFGALEDVRAALRAVLDIGAEALAGLRSVEAVLAMRGEEVPPARSATPGLGDLTVLAERWAGVGLLVRAAGSPGSLPPVIDQAAYRVVQEALANIARHSCALHADIALHRDGEQFTLVISDCGPPRASCVPVGWGAGEESEPEAPCGRGLSRMRERVGTLGGAFSAGTDGVGWCVHVVFPAGPVG